MRKSYRFANIKFIADAPQAEQWALAPVPAVRQIPDWYRKMGKHPDGETKLKVHGPTKNLTLKTCIPFFDAMTLGYHVLLSADIIIEQQDEAPFASWCMTNTLVTEHQPWQTQNVPVPEGMSSSPFKWQNFFRIVTPKGWSSLIIHPMNRHDLPFETIAGVVDTDTWNLAVNFPFFLSKSFEGKIEKGTPIAQIIPIKRQEWVSKVQPFPDDHELSEKRFFSHVEKYYKRFFWTRKEYS